MKKIITGLSLLFFLSFVGYKVIERINWQNQEQPTQARYQATTVVKVWPTRAQLLRETLKTVGEIITVEEALVQPRVSGQLLRILVKEGEHVEAGQLLAEIDDRTLQVQLLQSEHNLAILTTNLNQALLRLEQAAAEKERYSELLDHRYISQREFEQIESTYLSAQTAWQVLTEQLATAQANHELLELQLTQAKIHSPLSGFVLKQHVAAGMNVSPGTTLFTIAPLNRVKLKFHLDQREATKVESGTRIEFTTDALPGQLFTGRIQKSSPVYEPTTRTLGFTAILPNEPLKLEPGMFGTVAIILQSSHRAITVPQEALVTLQGQNGVFVVDATQTARFKPVETGMIVDHLVEITSGLEEGEAVVIIGQARLRDQQKVEVLVDEENPIEIQQQNTTTGGEGS
ncbi:MAG: efflux RND transporter periplasmic adaptor subunit [Firmicutes bacterium]|nr:efflux RND transporter periplasmic adaptor subunit [Bacillota bacterium]